MPQQRDSLLTQHHRILGYSEGPASESDREEQARIERLRLPPLRLPPQRASVWARFASGAYTPRPHTTGQWAGLVAMAAALVIAAIYWPQADDSLRMKGTHHISVFWERDGHVEPWSEGTLLLSGDRVRAEILASDPIVAYAAIADAQGKLLVPAEQIHASAQRLSAGERKAFPGSFKLVGPAEGETLVILICEKETLATGLLEEVRTREESILTRNQLPKGCDMQLFPLR